MSKYVFFDTETTGLPRDYKAPASDTSNWPRIVQISWLNGEEGGVIGRDEDHIIKPVGFTIPVESSNVHGITTERALREGEDLRETMVKFYEDCQDAEYIVGHNVGFDVKVAQCECIRLGLPDPFVGKKILCTMQASTNYCKIPGRFGYKWPKLDELYVTLFGCHFEDAHNSFADIKATFDCFWKLREKGLI